MDPVKRRPVVRLALTVGVAVAAWPVITATTHGAETLPVAGAGPERVVLAQAATSTPPSTDAPSAFAAMVAAADVAAGQMAAIQCVGCHTVTEGGPTIVGPNLFGVVDRQVAAVPGFNYSAALAAAGASGSHWTVDFLNAFLTSPQAAIPGTTMPFGGIADETTRANLIAYLATLKNDETATGDQTAAPVLTPVSFSTEQANRGRTRYDRECAECHGEDLSGGLNGGPPLSGLSFMQRYANGAPASRLFTFMSTQMPPQSPGRFSAEAYADLMAYVLQRLGFQAGDPLPSTIEALDQLAMER